MSEGGKVLHVDGSAGIAGDMVLGALVDLGVPLDALRAGLEGLRVPGLRLTASYVLSHGLRATRVRVMLDGVGEDHLETAHDHEHASHAAATAEGAHGRTFAAIEELVGTARLPERVERRALAIFRRLCEAEAALHGTTLDRVHLHEVGAADALVDVVGTCLGLERLGVDRVTCGPPELGTGTVRCAHGVLPVPTPATLALLTGRPVKSSGVEGELTTPTGAAILATLSESWGALPPMVIERVGHGAGTRELPDRPNVVRLTLGAPVDAGGDDAARDVVEIVADLDDAAPEQLAAAADLLRERGALEVVVTPATMKKGRSGVRLSILANASAREALVDLLFAETSTIGCRWHRVERAECARRVVTLDTPHGPIRVKLATWKGRVVNAKPEHDDCLAAARRSSVPLKAVVNDVLAALAAHDMNGRSE